MDELATGILRRSSDAVVILGLTDGTVVDVNEAYCAMTGYARHELVGRLGRDLLVGLAAEADSTAGEALGDIGSITDVPVSFWTRSEELRVGDLSALVLKVKGQHDALCTIRGVRNPTPEQERSVARKELERVLHNSHTWSEAATRALRAFGRCLGWDVGALWRGPPQLKNLRRVAVWPAPPVELGPFKETARHAGLPAANADALRQVQLRGDPIWIADASTSLERERTRAGFVGSLRGWLGFPALGTDGVLGVVEFVSRETQPADSELLEMIEDFGHLFGRLLEDAQAPDLRLIDEADAPGQGSPALSSGTVADTLRDLAGAVATASEALERYPSLQHDQPPGALRELSAGIGRLNQLLEQAVQRSADDSAPEVRPARPAEATGEPLSAVPTGLTLKAVSRRTGIPAATLRTWEHRYRFLRPNRSPAGYRLYGEEEIARIERVKRLVEQGVRIGAAMKSIIEESGDDLPTDDAEQSADQDGPGEDGKQAEVYRLPPRPPRGRRS